MRFRIVAVGKIKEPYLKDGIAEYAKRLSGSAVLEITEVADEPLPNRDREAEAARILDREGERILGAIQPGETVVLLDVGGSMWSSEELAGIIRENALAGRSRIAFVIGGTLGAAPAVRARADYRWSLSRATFPHQIVRLLVAEQVYRAVRIIRGEAYHR
ncbi:MAG: 23S rRNA (pseudouridine(1915)-N(3))-methyltransferase RlmH [Methanomicrobiales archaeon]|nr:23S rRNA (pseudouridine(1915)-N(3))-methyltransferase RlmH [Methanomicrobiales archaeon]